MANGTLENNQQVIDQQGGFDAPPRQSTPQQSTALPKKDPVGTEFYNGTGRVDPVFTPKPPKGIFEQALNFMIGEANADTPGELDAKRRFGKSPSERHADRQRELKEKLRKDKKGLIENNPLDVSGTFKPQIVPANLKSKGGKGKKKLTFSNLEKTARRIDLSEAMLQEKKGMFRPETFDVMLQDYREKLDANKEARKESIANMFEMAKAAVTSNTQVDLSPLASYVDAQTGSNFAPYYRRPRGEENRAAFVKSLQRGIANEKNAIDKNERDFHTQKLETGLARQKAEGLNFYRKWDLAGKLATAMGVPPGSRGSMFEMKQPDGRQLNSHAYHGRMKTLHAAMTAMENNQDVDPTDPVKNLLMKLTGGLYMSDKRRAYEAMAKTYAELSVRDLSGANAPEHEQKLAKERLTATSTFGGNTKAQLKIFQDLREGENDRMYRKGGWFVDSYYDSVENLGLKRPGGDPSTRKPPSTKGHKRVGGFTKEEFNSLMATDRGKAKAAMRKMTSSEQAYHTGI